MKVGDRVRIRLNNLEYSKEAFKVVRVHGDCLVVDVTNNPYGIGWFGCLEPSLKLNSNHFYWFTDSYIKEKPKLFI